MGFGSGPVEVPELGERLLYIIEIEILKFEIPRFEIPRFAIAIHLSLLDGSCVQPSTNYTPIFAI